MKNKFKYNLGDSVILNMSGETGEVVGRGEYINSDNNYLLRYVTADRRQVEGWWNEDAFHLYGDDTFVGD